LFESRVLRRIFEPKRDEATGKWRKLHNEELNDLYFSSNFIRVTKSRRKRLVGHIARVVERCIQGLVGTPKGKRPLGRRRNRWRII